MEVYIGQHENSSKPPSIQTQDIGIYNLKIRYPGGDTFLLNIDSLSIHKAQIVGIIGSSGAGKTTLLRTIGGFINPTSGSIRIASNHRGNIGFIFQNFNLIGRATVFDNVLFGRLGKTGTIISIMGMFSDRDKDIAYEAIREVNLLNKIDQRTDTLSGGEMQRVAIARVIAQEAGIILADEPVSNLDPALSREILDLLAETCTKYSTTLIINLHQPILAKKYVQRIIGLRNGKIVYNSDSSQLESKHLNSIYESDFESPVMFESRTKAQIEKR